MINKKYITHKREIFFEIAKKYISKDSRVLDIGAGNASFSRICEREDFYLYEGNPSTYNSLKSKYKNVVLGHLPKLSFEDNFFDVIHCSHVVEHLETEVFYQTLVEMDRCLKNNGKLIISAPLFWKGFYDDLSHIRPYPPAIFKNYLCAQENDQRTRPIISTDYEMVEEVFRYKEIDFFENIYNNKVGIILKVIIMR